MFFFLRNTNRIQEDLQTLQSEIKEIFIKKEKSEIKEINVI